MILKLKQTPAIFLVGFMGSGKTTIGKLLAEKLGWTFVDLDEDIERSQQTSIAAIFENQGEAAFRAMESKALLDRVREVRKGKPLVIALGGGAFAQPGNPGLLEQYGVTVWLDCPLEAIRRRIARETHRPLARDAVKFEELFHARRAAYSQAEYTIPVTDDDPRVAVDAILALSVFK
ncbi:MAG: shikimate kinase [Acidobacteria bacterium]|nr:shikimate kinase [Acidobacteriota bacterium]MBI3471538.1 shikimate kinase [Candidatus Solibacter usitatus]